MALLVYSPQCPKCQEVLQYIQGVPELHPIMSYHDITRIPIPPQYSRSINRVPSLITKQRAIIVGQQEIVSWLDSLVPKRIECCDLSGGFGGMSGLDGSSEDGMFSLDSFGQSLSPIMTKDLEAKINRDPKNGSGNLAYSPTP